MVNLLIWIVAPVAAWPTPGSPPANASDAKRGAAQSAEENQLLEPGKPIERELSGGRSHFYKTHDADSYANGPFARAVLIPILEFSFWVHYYHPKGGSSPCPLLMKPPTRA